jgi:methionyl-tRNA formyltransferase
MRVVFAGTPGFAEEHLRFLLDHTSHEVIAVYTQPDRPAGRGKKITASPVKQLAEAHGLLVHQPSTLRDANAQQALINLNPDLMIVVAYGLILPKNILAIPRHGCINVHASLLPRWRGAAPIQRAIEAGDIETGVTIMQMDEGLDTGDSLLSISCAIEDIDTAATLHDKLSVLGCSALNEVLQQINNHELQPKKQDNARASYAQKISKVEAKIDWTLPATVLEKKIRAFNPHPVAFFEIDSDPVRIWGAACLNENTSQLPGTILSLSKEGIRIATGNKILLLEKLQLPGKKLMSVGDVLNGHAHHFSAGKILH